MRSRDESPRALVLVRNGVTHDARVHREVETLRRSGFRPLVIGVVAPPDTARHGVAGGAPVLRLSPRSPMARLRDRLGRTAAAPSAGRPTPAAPRPVSGGSSPLGALARRAHRALTAADFHRQAVGALRAHRPVLVHCNDWNTMWAGLAARAFGAYVVYDAHELWPDRNGRPEWRPWLLACEALYVRAADAVITTSPGYARVLASRYRIRTPAVVRNVPVASSVRGGAASSPPGRPPILAYAGGLLRGRGLEQAIDALALLPELRLELIGPGSAAYRDELAARARELRVLDRVSVRGPVPPDEVVAALATADVGLCLIQPVCLSYELTLPNKLYEYAAAGLPILASDLPVIAAAVREFGAGEVVPPSAPDAIAAGLRRLLDGSHHAACRRGALALARGAAWPEERQRLHDVYAMATSHG